MRRGPAFPPEVISRGDLAAYLGIDYEDHMVNANLDLACGAANGYVYGAVGELPDPSDPRARALALAVAADVYDERSYESGGGSAKASGAVRKLVASLSEQLRCEAR